MNALFMSDRLVASLAWMLVHFLWQGFAVGLLLAAAVRFGRIQRATSRYCCSLVALMALAAAPFATLLLMLPAPQRTVELFRPEIPLMSNPVDMPHHNSIEAQTASVAVRPGIAAVNRVVPSTPPDWDMVQRLIVGAWLCGVAGLLMRLVVGWMGVRRLHGDSLAAPDWLNVRLRETARAMQVTVPLLQISERITEAMAFGIVKPMILLPAAWVSDVPADMLEAVVAHELAHIRRHDLWVNLLQRLVESLLFYHPAVWWLSRRLRIERELCCDQAAIAITGNPLRYAETLEHVGRLSLASQTPRMAVAVGGPRSHLLSRIRSVLHAQPAEDSSWAGLVVLAPVVLVAIVCASLTTEPTVAAPLDPQPLATQQADPQQPAHQKPTAEKPAAPVNETTPKREEPAAAVTAAPAAAADVQNPRVLAGRVVDSHGKPVADADVLLFQQLDLQPGARPVLVVGVKTNAEGHFQITAPAKTFQQAAVWSIVPWKQDWLGSSLGWGVQAVEPHPPAGGDAKAEAERDCKAEQLTIKLRNATGRIEVLDPHMKPIPAVKAQVTELFAAAKTTGPDGSEVTMPDGNRVRIPAEFQNLLTGRTNAEGIIQIEGLDPTRIAGMEVETEEFGRQAVSSENEYRGKTVGYRFQLASVGRIEGQVTAPPGFALDGLKLGISTRTPVTVRKRLEMQIDHPHIESRDEVVVDANGRFVVPKLAEGFVRIDDPFAMDSPVALALANQRPRTIYLEGGRTLDLSLNVIKTIPVTGIVQNVRTGQPVPGVEVVLETTTAQIRGTPQVHTVMANSNGRYSIRTTPGTAWLLPWFSRVRTVTTDANGRYTARVTPGMTWIRLKSRTDGYASVRVVAYILESAESRELPRLDLIPVKTRSGKLLDKNGNPVRAAWTIEGFSGDLQSRSCQTKTAPDGTFVLEYPETQPPTVFTGRENSSYYADSRTVELLIVTDDPLVLQLQDKVRGTQADLTLMPAKLNSTQLQELRKKRLAANDREAANKLTGTWKLTLPAGATYTIELSQREDGCVVLDCPRAINIRGTFAVQGDKVDLVETRVEGIDDFVWEKQKDGSLKLVHEQHKVGGHYVGATLTRVSQ